jgi:hypothetical protein
VTTNGSTVPAPDHKWEVGSLVKWELPGESCSARRRNMPITLRTAYLTVAALGLNLGLHSEKLWTNCLTCGTVHECINSIDVGVCVESYLLASWFVNLIVYVETLDLILTSWMLCKIQHPFFFFNFKYLTFWFSHLTELFSNNWEVTWAFFFPDDYFAPHGWQDEPTADMSSFWNWHIPSSGSGTCSFWLHQWGNNINQCSEWNITADKR